MYLHCCYQFQAMVRKREPDLWVPMLLLSFLPSGRLQYANSFTAAALSGAEVAWTCICGHHPCPTSCMCSIMPTSRCTDGWISLSCVCVEQRRTLLGYRYPISCKFKRSSHSAMRFIYINLYLYYILNSFLPPYSLVSLQLLLLPNS